MDFTRSIFGHSHFAIVVQVWAFFLISMAAGGLSVARFRLKVNPPTELRNRHDCTRLLRQHLDPAAYRSIGKRLHKNNGKECYFELKNLDHKDTILAALKPLGVLKQLPDAVESLYPYDLIVAAAANDKCLCAFITDLQILAERNQLPRDIFLRPPRNTPMWNILKGTGIDMPCPTGRRQFDLAANDRLPAMVRNMFDVSDVGHQLNLERTHVELQRALGIQQSIERSVSSSHRAAPY